MDKSNFEFDVRIKIQSTQELPRSMGDLLKLLRKTLEDKYESDFVGCKCIRSFERF